MRLKFLTVAILFVAGITLFVSSASANSEFKAYGWATMSGTSGAMGAPKQVTIRFHSSATPANPLTVDSSFMSVVHTDGTVAFAPSGSGCTGNLQCSAVSQIVVPLSKDGTWTVQLVAASAASHHQVRSPYKIGFSYASTTGNQQRTMDVYLQPCTGACVTSTTTPIVDPAFGVSTPDTTLVDTVVNYDPTYANNVTAWSGGSTGYLKAYAIDSSSNQDFTYTSTPSNQAFSPPPTITVPSQPLTNDTYTYTVAAFGSAGGGSSEATFTFVKDSVAPVASCSVSANNLKFYASAWHTTDETIDVTVGGTDALSGVQKGDVSLVLTNGTQADSVTDAYLTTANNGNLDIANSAPYNNPGNFTFTYNTTTTPPSFPTAGNIRGHLFRYKVWDKSYNSAGVKNQSNPSGASFLNCTSQYVYVDPHVDLEVVSVQLYRDSARTDLISTGATVYEGQTVYPKVTFRNYAPNSVAGPFKVSFYINSSNPTSGSPATSLVSGDYTNIGANTTTDVWGAGDLTSVTIPTGVTQINPNAWVDYQDLVVEDDDTDNYFNPSPGYGVTVPAWFKSTGGDVGAVGSVTVSQNPVTDFQSKYMLIQGGANNTSSSNSSWKLNNYNAALFPQTGGPHTSSIFNSLWSKLQSSRSGDYTNLGPPSAYRWACNMHKDPTPGNLVSVLYNGSQSYTENATGEKTPETFSSHDVIRCNSVSTPHESDETWSDGTFSNADGTTFTPTLSAAITGDRVTAINVDNEGITDCGSGIRTAPSVIISGGGGYGAKARATVTIDCHLGPVIVTDGGQGYTSAPTVTLGGAGQHPGNNVYIVDGDLNLDGNFNCCLSDSGSTFQAVDGGLVIEMIDKGEGYVAQPIVNVSGCTSLCPNFTANYAGGKVNSITVGSIPLGGVYTSNPTVAISAPTGLGTKRQATARAKIQSCMSGEQCLNMFVVYGDLNVKTAANEIDGVFLVGGTFRDYTAADGVVGPTLTVNGAVYAQNMDLKRKSSAAGAPALIVNFDPRVYFNFGNICGETQDATSGTVEYCYSLGAKKLDWEEKAP